MKISSLILYRNCCFPFWTLFIVIYLSIVLCNDVRNTQPPETATVLDNSSDAGEEHKQGTDTVATLKVDNKVDRKDNLNGDSKIDLNGADSLESSFDKASTESQSNEESYLPSDYAFSEVASQNAGIPNEVNDQEQIVVTLIDTATADLQRRAEQSSSQTRVKETEGQRNASIQESQAQVDNTTHIQPEESSGSASSSSSSSGEQTEEKAAEVPNDAGPAKENLTEEIPSFSEWSQKQLEEAEKKREEVNSSAQHQSVNGRNSSNIKVRSKNYASPDCGAKIVASNPEAVSPSSVLSPSRDEYKLNTCTSRIWFIVELCEAIQAKKIDLANFELFSSSPKEFSVSVSDRFPSREWSNVGHFTAKDERDVQSFDLHPHLFGKYIKVEMHSHHGSEHFCPISLFRVYGTSEFEVLEKEDQPHSADDDDDDETLDSESGPSAKNLFSSATDAVISIVKKAAEVLGNKGNSSDTKSKNTIKERANYSPLVSSCTTPSHIVVCDNCSDVLFGSVFELMSCRSQQLKDLLGISLINSTIYNTNICATFGLKFQKKLTEGPATYSSYVKSFFPTRYIAALCNTVAILENKVVLNVSKQVNASDSTTESVNFKTTTLLESTASDSGMSTENVVEITTTTTILESGKTESGSAINEAAFVGSETAQIKPTKTLSESNIEVTNSPVHSFTEKTTTEDPKTTQTPPVDDVVKKGDGDVNSTTEASGEHIGEYEHHDPVEHLDLENLMSDFENNNGGNSATPAPPKESVFLRLSNRIKSLERNMSLSTQYLEELSRRYKKQVEEIQRLLLTMNEENKKHEEQVARLEAKIGDLTEAVSTLMAENNAGFNPLHWFVLIVVSTFVILTFCRRNDLKLRATNGSGVEVQRRKSINIVNHNTPVKKERRPSEEALKISGTYEHLMVDETESRRKTKERRRKRKKEVELRRSSSITTLADDHHHIWSEFHPKGTSSQVFQVNHAGRTADTDVPVVLEESDNNPLQDVPLPKPLREKQVVNGNVKPVRKISSPAFLKGVEIRKTKLVNNGVLGTFEKGHKKSASVDETKRDCSPTSSQDSVSAGNAPESKGNSYGQRKEKKTGLKKIFKKVF